MPVARLLALRTGEPEVDKGVFTDSKSSNVLNRNGLLIRISVSSCVPFHRQPGIPWTDI